MGQKQCCRAGAASSSGAVARYGSGGSGSNSGNKHGLELKNDTKCISL
jgi:hypothetical protein